MWRHLHIVLLTLGLLFLGFGCYLVNERVAPRSITFESPAPSIEPGVLLPTRLTIQRIDIDLPIIPAQIIGKRWQTTSAGISYLSTSPLPGNPGNSVMYGHNWSNLLGSLKKAKVGDTILVTKSDGTVVSFTVHFISVVSPDESHIYGNTPDTRLTLYTCTGFLDTHRLVITAILNS